MPTKLTKLHRIVSIRLPETDTLVVDKSKFLTNEFGVITKKQYKKNEIIFIVSGPIHSKPTKYSFSIDLNRHIEPISNDGSFGFGHYLNHSCNPNTKIRLAQKNTENPYLEVVARKRIESGEELTFDYASLEYDLTVANSLCKCKTLQCRGKIQGFKDLSFDIVNKYKKEGIIADYLFRIG